MRSIPTGGLALIATAILLTGVLASDAQGDSTAAANFVLRFSSQQPGSDTGAVLDIHYKNPVNSDAAPSPQRTITITAPAGTVFDGHAVPACTASDAQLMLLGSTACPAGSQVGVGTLTLLTGCGAPLDPFNDDVALFNGGDGLIELFTKAGTPARTAVGRRAYAAPNVLTETPAPTPGCPPPTGESVVTDLHYQFDKVRGPAGGYFLKTPPVCPADGVWRSQLSFTTADGHAYNVPDGSPCRGPRRTAPGAAIRVSVTPARVMAKQTTRLRVRLASLDPRCTRGAALRLRRLRARSAAGGETSLSVRFSRPGRSRLTATKPGCLAGAAFVNVVAPPGRGPRFTG